MGMMNVVELNNMNWKMLKNKRIINDVTICHSSSDDSRAATAAAAVESTKVV